VLGLQRCPSFAKHGSHAPPPVRHMTAIHEPGLKKGYGDLGLGLIRNQCLAVAVLRHIAVRQIFSPAITSPPFPLDYLCGGCAFRYLPDASISVNDSGRAIFSRIMNRGSYHMLRIQDIRPHKCCVRKLEAGMGCRRSRMQNSFRQVERWGYSRRPIALRDAQIGIYRGEQDVLRASK
jgi:hypothetical protein